MVRQGWAKPNDPLELLSLMRPWQQSPSASAFGVSPVWFDEPLVAEPFREG